jgi:NMD protein affecting ribosome stability and mRNA decay
MICPRCCQEREQSAFLMKSDVCYKCIYQEKTSQDIQKKDIKTCRICEKKCDENRWVYCSKECATIGELKQKKSHWTSKIKSL